MYNETYDEYIRSILGYPNPNIYDNGYNVIPSRNMSDIQNDELESYYPEIYQKIYPEICSACRNTPTPITKDVIDNMTNDIYVSIEGDIYNNTDKSTNKNTEINTNLNRRKNDDIRNNRPNNDSLRDLIRILIIRELLNRPNFPSNRPQRPPYPIMPPRI